MRFLGVYALLLHCQVTCLLLKESLALSVGRRHVLASSVASIIATTATTAPPTVFAVESSSTTQKQQQLAQYRSLIQQAQTQLESNVPSLINQEQWDSVRAILLTPPLSDLFKKQSLLLDYSSLVSDDNELAVLEARDDLQTHLRFLDMAVYNNVFNPIKSMGENGATRELVASYYEDPLREYKASRQALQELYELGGEQ